MLITNGANGDCDFYCTGGMAGRYSISGTRYHILELAAETGCTETVTHLLLRYGRAWASPERQEVLKDGLWQATFRCQAPIIDKILPYVYELNGTKLENCLVICIECGFVHLIKIFARYVKEPGTIARALQKVSAGSIPLAQLSRDIDWVGCVTLLIAAGALDVERDCRIPDEWTSRIIEQTPEGTVAAAIRQAEKQVQALRADVDPRKLPQA
jgi:hypothetical protein